MMEGIVGMIGWLIDCEWGRTRRGPWMGGYISCWNGRVTATGEKSAEWTGHRCLGSSIE